MMPSPRNTLFGIACNFCAAISPCPSGKSLPIVAYPCKCLPAFGAYGIPLVPSQHDTSKPAQRRWRSGSLRPLLGLDPGFNPEYTTPCQALGARDD